MNGFDYIKSVCAGYDIPALKRQIQAIDDMQGQNQLIDIVVFGQFKAGKSSFLNHLVGKDILPVGVIPVTAIITRIQYGSEEKAHIIQTDGTSFETPLDQIGQYITEKDNPNNQKQIERIEIDLPTLQSMPEFRFVDTPGLGSVFKHNTITSQDWFCHSGIALILIASNAPLSDNDLEIIRSVAAFTPEIRIILTKADLYNDEQLDEIQQFLSQSLTNMLDRTFSIQLYSIYQAEHREKIIDQIIKPIQSKRDRTFQDILEHKIQTLAHSAIRYFEVAYQSSMKSELGQKQLRDKILDEQMQIGYIKDDLRLVINDHKGKTRNTVEKILKAHQTKLEEEVTQAFLDAYPEWKGNLYKKSRRYEQWMKEILIQKLHSIAESEQHQMNEIVDKAKRHARQYAKSFRERLNSNIEAVLGVTMAKEDWPIHIQPLQKPDISVGKAFEIPLDMLWFLFPMVIFNNVFKNYFRNQISREVEKNIQRLISDLTEMIHAEMNRIQQQTFGYISDEIVTITNLLSAREKHDSEEYQRIIEKIADHYNISLI